MILKGFQKNKLNLVVIILLSFCFFIPLQQLGVNHYEENVYHFFSLEVFFQNKFNPFIFFYDLIGPGTKFPLGHGLFYFFPSSFFIGSKTIFFFLTIFLGI